MGTHFQQLKLPGFNRRDREKCSVFFDPISSLILPFLNLFTPAKSSYSSTQLSQHVVQVLGSHTKGASHHEVKTFELTTVLVVGIVHGIRFFRGQKDTFSQGCLLPYRHHPDKYPTFAPNLKMRVLTKQLKEFI